MFDKLQNTLTALFFLAALLAGAVYLGLGLNEQRFLPGEGFVHLDKPLSFTTRQHRVKSAPDRAAKGEPVALTTLLQQAQSVTTAVEQTLTDTLDDDHLFIESYGLLQKLLGRRVVEDVDPQYTVARLTDGTLSFANLDAVYQEPSQQAEAVIDLRDTLLETFQIPLLYIQAPQKVYYNGDAALPEGLEDVNDAQGNAFLYALEQAGVDTLDLRPLFTQAGIAEAEEAALSLDPDATDFPWNYPLFYTTDHHWTGHGAFYGWQRVAKTLEADYGFSIDPALTDLSQWKSIRYEDLFLGSQGKRVGSLYAGVDDFYTLYPKQSSSFHYTVPFQNIDRQGRYETALLFPERLEEGDLYETNPYTYYSGGDYPFARMKNLRNPDGPTVVLLRDSFSCAFAPLLANVCGELVTIDLRYFNDDLMNYIRWVEADMVLLLYAPGTLRTEACFDFFSVPSASRPADRKPLEQVLSVEKPTAPAYAPVSTRTEDTPAADTPSPVFSLPLDGAAGETGQQVSSLHFQAHPLKKTPFCLSTSSNLSVEEEPAA